MEQQKERRQQRPCNEIIVPRLSRFCHPVPSLCPPVVVARPSFLLLETRRTSISSGNTSDAATRTRPHSSEPFFSSSWRLSSLGNVSLGIRCHVDDIPGLFAPRLSLTVGEKKIGIRGENEKTGTGSSSLSRKREGEDWRSVAN